MKNQIHNNTEFTAALLSNKNIVGIELNKEYYGLCLRKIENEVKDENLERDERQRT